MRTLLLMTLLLTPACGRWDTPWVDVGAHSIKEPWASMGLPTGGGRVLRSDDDAMVLTYKRASQRDRKSLARTWDGSFVGQGWQVEERYGDLGSRGLERARYSDKKGRRVLLEMQQTEMDIRVSLRNLPRR